MISSTKLGSLQPFLAVLIILIFFLGFSLLLFFMTRRFTDQQMRRRHNDIVGYIFTTIGAIYGVFLAFLTVIVWQNYNDAATNAAREATAALAVYRDLGLYPEQEQAREVVLELLAYLKVVAAEEFPAMAENKKSPATTEAITRLWDKFHALTPRTIKEQVLFQEILKNLNVMAQLRFERLVLAFNPKLSSLMRNILIIGAVITIACAICLGAENFWWHIFLTSLLIALLSTILFALMELANPFTSGIAIQADDYLEALKLMQNK